MPVCQTHTSKRKDSTCSRLSFFVVGYCCENSSSIILAAFVPYDVSPVVNVTGIFVTKFARRVDGITQYVRVRTRTYENVVVTVVSLNFHSFIMVEATGFYFVPVSNSYLFCWNLYSILIVNAKELRV